MKASELIYESAKNKKIPSAKKEINYSFADGKEEGTCFICGRSTHKGFPKKEILKPTFTDYQYCINRQSDIVCECCSFCLSFSELRNYSIFATSNVFEHPSLSRCKELILHNTETPFILCIAVSGQKWLHIKSTVNYNSENIIVNLEENKISLNRKEFAFLLKKIEELYTFGFTKEEIKKLKFNSTKILNFGIKRFEQIFKEVEKYKKTKLLELCCYLAQKEENDL